MSIVDIAQIVSAGVAVLSFAGSVIVYRRTLNRERKLDTIKMLSEIRMKYPKIFGLSYKAKKKYIKELEFFATGVNQKIYDIKIVSKMSGSRLIYQYEKYLKKIIKKIEKMLAPFNLGSMPETPAAVTVNRANQILNSL